ncbi:MAG: hypothetical protein LBU51_08085 [Bacteroidales bacterium]|jgi:hypothetical protein|nr:hypothetical protein [Bacteroidales bacterium]
MSKKIKKSLRLTIEGMKMSKTESERIIGGTGSTGSGSRDAWICIGAGCNPGCNTNVCETCTLCASYSSICGNEPTY